MTQSVVHGVDHVFVPLTNAGGAHKVLTETLGLPTAWPYLAYPGFAGGGVNFGNLNLELLRHSDAGPGLSAHSPARVQGIAFHPVATRRVVEELDRRGIAHSRPEVFPPGSSVSTGAMWTNVTVDPLCGPASNVFTCEYHIPGPQDYHARQASLDACGGGPLGLTGVREIVISSPQPTAAIDRWQRLLDPVSPVGPGYWELEHGPALRVVAGATDTVERVVVTVRSLAGIEPCGTELVKALHGLDVRFVEVAAR